MIPPEVVEIRRENCAECAVEDPCAACRHGRWGQYEQIGCPQPVAPVTQPPPQPQTQTQTQAASIINRPGLLFAEVIFRITGVRQGGCQCAVRQSQMDAWGWWGCLKNIRTIAGWLTEEANKRGHDIGEAQIVGLFMAAWREYRAR